MPAAHPPDLKQQALKLVAAGLSPGQAAVKLGLTRSAVRNWTNKANLPEIKELAQEAVVAMVNREVDQRVSQIVRAKLGEVVASHATMLANAPALCVEELKNTPDRQGLAAVTKTVVEAASAVFGWDAERAGGILILDAGRRFDQPAIVCDSAPERDTKTVDIESATTTSPPNP